MKKLSLVHWAIGALGAAMILGVGAQGVAQGSLVIGGSAANYGVHNISFGFTPDPSQYSIVSGGNLDVRTMNLGPGCVGYGTARPDMILRVSGSSSFNFLRFYYQPAGGGDTALVINGPTGRWHCNDDTQGLNPQVDFTNPQAGHYDIWVTSYQAGANIQGTLHITELTSNSVRP